jgi:hypothetical protein
MPRDYRRIFPIEGKKFVTKQGSWRATVGRYPAAVSAGDLLQLKIDFESEDLRNESRSLHLWVKDAPDVTLVAESIGMLQAINWWLEEFKGDDELLYDSGSGDLVLYRGP